MFYFDNINGFKVLRSDMLKEVNAFFTTRNSPLPIGEDFLSDTGLKKQKLKNSPYFEKSIRIITPDQTHSDHIEIVDTREEYPDTDGLILSEQNTAICLRFADCTPLVFFDKKKNIAAISHAGWRGTAARIGVKTVAKMILNFSSKMEDIVVLIGPAISKCCYEVSEDVKEQLISTVKDTKGLFENRKVDLKEINARQLEEIGIKSIDICPYCTFCNNDLFYSYRKENGTQNRHYAIISL